uniref:Uncharacterized protein n=1 Tax=Arundo donax TaxID=35708 RepID=A0A0A9BBX9_ARUDO
MATCDIVLCHIQYIFTT